MKLISWIAIAFITWTEEKFNASERLITALLLFLIFWETDTRCQNLRRIYQASQSLGRYLSGKKEKVE